MCINGNFMLLFELIPDPNTSEGHASQPENGNIRIELKMPEAIMCLLCLEFEYSIRVDF